MAHQDPQLFYVGIKAFLVRGKKVLLVKEADTQQWEVPGGRINVGEEFLNHKEILKREIFEELGSHVTYEVAGLASSFSRQRNTSQAPGSFVTLIAFYCTYLSGEITLSHEHSEYAWVDAQEMKALDILPAYVQPLIEFFSSL